MIENNRVSAYVTRSLMNQFYVLLFLPSVGFFNAIKKIND